MKLITVTILIFILSSIHFCYGDDFRYLRTNEGLYNGEINSISQDKSGKMWFATWTGLASYNGFDFQFFKPELGNPLSLSDKKTHKLCIDSKDNLWVASLSGVSYYRRQDQTFHPVSMEGLSPMSYYVFGIYETRGHILIHCNTGIFLVIPSGKSDTEFHAKKLKLYSGNTQVFDYVHYLNTFKEQLVLVSNKDASDPTRIMVSDLVVTNKDTLLSVKQRITYKQGVNAISSVKDENSIYLGTTDGIALLSLENMNITDHLYFKGINIQNLLCASNHKIYCYSSEVSLYYADMNTHQTGCYLPDPLKSGSILDNNITCLFEDFSGNLWVGNQGLGLSILNLNSKAFYSYKHDPANPKSLIGNIVMCFNGTSGTRGEIFLGMRQGGINVTPKQKSADGSSEFRLLTYQQQSGISSEFNSIWDIARESETLFWVASNGGVARLEKTGKGWIYGSPGEKPLYEGVVRKVLIDKDRNIWVGTFGDGLKFFPALSRNPERKSYAFPPDPANAEAISDKNILSMLIDSKNRFWVGTNNGLNLVKTPYNQLDLSGSQKPDIRFKKYIAVKPDEHFLNANEINCIYENSDGKIWLATQGGGINIMSPDSGKFSHITDENGLHGNDVLGILADRSGRKWISTNMGIATLDLTNKTKPFTWYNIADGLQGQTYKVNSFYQSADGEMFFGGDNGYSRFYPEQIKSNPIPPKIGLTFFRFQNKIINIGDTISSGKIMTSSLDEMDHIELPYQKNSFSIGVGVHHYQYPEGNMIRYKLDGFFDRWITVPASNKYIYFSKLPYGKYLLHVSGLSADNVEAKSERLFEIRILPPWYLTWYMRILFFMLVIVLIGYIFYWQTIRQKTSFQKKIDDLSFQNNENRMKFLTNIAHELRTPLSLVIAPIEDMQTNYSTIDPKWKNHLNLIYRNSNYLLTLINQIIDFRKLNAGKLQLNLQKTDLVSLVGDVVSNFKGLESRRKANLSVQLPDHAIFVSIDRQKIEEVLYNLLSNAFKHTIGDNNIRVTLEHLTPGTNIASLNGKELIRITVFNEGKDISDEDKLRIFEQFYKVSENVEGAGIGLSFSKSLIEMHDGTITVESVDGIGVAFHINLPFDMLETGELETSPVKAPESWQEDVFDSEQVQVHKHRDKETSLVIVEDNIDLRTFLRKKLSEDYDCHEAGDGKEGYELISRILPDIVISDVVMPKMDGYELCVKVKQNNKTCHIPIILLTSNNAPEHIVSGYEKGADAYVTKPFDMSVIQAQISRLIKNRELIREKYMTQNFMVEVSTSNLSKDDEFIIKLRQLLEENLSESDFNVKRLSSDLNISTTHLYRKLKALTGLSPVEFIRAFKLQKACEMLSNTNNSIKEIGYGLGFNNLSYFVKCFREQFDVTPSMFRQKGLPDSSKKSSTNQSEVS